MLTITLTETFGWNGAVRGMRNPKNSWELSDSNFASGNILVGPDDLRLMKVLINSSDERKFLRMIHVQADVTAPLYWWKEYDTYKVGTVANSCSTMHKITAKEFTMDDFSTEHLEPVSKAAIGESLVRLNDWRGKCLIQAKKDTRRADLPSWKTCWWQLIQMLPTSYNQTRTIDLNYEVLLALYPRRKAHKLDEWHIFCDWIEKLPYMKCFLEARYGN